MIISVEMGGGDELAEIFRILKIWVLRYDVKWEPYLCNVE